MSATAQAIELSADTKDVTQISANARIDYILRFSKQAILVVDEQAEVYSQVASQYLANLSGEQNAALVPVSAKLNDIQIRCRIVEQLFANSLFDPEQSLAVSIFNLAQQYSEAISIVVEHAHLLSLQLLHELCQLAEIAKKSKLDINVLLLGNQQAGALMTNHKSLFENKLTLLSAKNGQLISLSSKLFKPSASLFQLSPMKKFIIGFTSLSLLLVLVVIGLYQRDTMGFSLLNEIVENKPMIEASLPVANSTDLAEKVKPVAEPALNIEQEAKASAQDIFLTLTGSPDSIQNQLVQGEPLPSGPATPADIVEAIAAFATPDIDTAEIEQTPNGNKEIVEAKLSEPPTTAIKVESLHEWNTINSGYYQSSSEGFIIQYAGFREQRVLDAFAREFPQLTYMAYQRLLAENELIVVTSEIFANRADAEAKLADLPEALLARGPWIKSLETVNNEINAYQGSH